VERLQTKFYLSNKRVRERVGLIQNLKKKKLSENEYKRQLLDVMAKEYSKERTQEVLRQTRVVWGTDAE
jgi:hypothetical protein